MTAMELNTPAPPLPRPCSLHLGPPAPGSPVAAIDFCSLFLIPPPRRPSRDLGKTSPARAPPPRFLLRKGAVAAKSAWVFRMGTVPAQTTKVSRKTVPAAQPTKARVPGKAVVDQPEFVLPEDAGEPLLHGLPRHKLMLTCGAKELLAAKTVAMPMPATAAMPYPTLAARLAPERSRNQKNTPFLCVRPRACMWRCKWKPTPTSTLPSAVPLPELAPLQLGLGFSTTVIPLSNIWNKLEADDMIVLLDEHCAHAIRVDRALHYLIYLLMNFRWLVHTIYSFTKDNRSRLLEERGWNVTASAETTQIDSTKIQLFVKVDGKSISIQDNVNTLTVKELVEAACQKAGVNSNFFYATYAGRSLDKQNLVRSYQIFRDSTINLVSRLRGGRNFDLHCESFSELMSRNANRRFHQVNLSALSRNVTIQSSSVTFLSRFAAYHIHKILVFLCGKHREGISFNGQFTKDDILIVNGMFVIFEPTVLECNFTESTCRNDYKALRKVFNEVVCDGGVIVPMYFGKLLQYLQDCPAKGNSNSEAVIQFVTNHPAISSYADRIKQCVFLDGMVNRLSYTDKVTLRNAVGTSNWKSDVQDTPVMETVYLFNHTRHRYSGALIVNGLYTVDLIGCVHFAKNYFVHADYQVILEEVEAAFAQTITDFMHDVLLNMAMQFTSPPNGFDMLTLLGNSTADPFTGR